MPEATAPELDFAKLTLFRDLVRSARDPEAESFPLIELAQSIREAALTPLQLYQRLDIQRWPI